MEKISAVVAMYNEENNVTLLCQKLEKVLTSMGKDYEIILVNDGSTDSTLRTAQGIISNKVKLVNLSRRQGQAAAWQAGFDLARGNFIVTLDADLQNDPDDIPLLWRKLQEGWDMVCGWRKERKDSWARKLVSRLSCCMRRSLTGENIHDFGCSLRIFKREAVAGFRLSGGLHRFITFLTAMNGYKVTEVPVNHFLRHSGRSKYGVLNRVGSLVDFAQLLARMRGSKAFSDKKKG